MKKLLIFLVSLLALNNLSAQRYTETYIKDANKIGLEWWNQINNKEYKESYIKLSDIVKHRYSLESWEKQMSMLMDEFGILESRIVKNTYFQSELEGLEDGFYVIIEYEVQYSKTRNHSEDLLLKQNDQLQWEILEFKYMFQSLETED